ncbi:MAG TPA: hypothetical protein PLK34_01380 [Candidatus Pacearchaeota archaeon]|nr:hypothetical protein [Candidatus Pacearchaeota archaeon]
MANLKSGFKLLTFILIGFLLITLIQNISASSSEQELNFFWKTGCPYCEKEKIFLQELQKDYPELKINNYSVDTPENRVLLKQFFDDYKIPSSYFGLVPMTFVGEKWYLGFEDSIGQEIRDYLEKGNNNNQNQTDSSINLPILGKVDLEKYSLIGLSVVLGFVDGFNVCSLGALIFVLGVVLGLGSRKKILAVGSFFILTVSFIYWLLMLVWYKAFTFLGSYLPYMNIAVGLISIAGGIYYLIQFFKFKKHGPTCETSKGTIITKFRDGIKEMIKNPKSALTMVLAVIAFSAIVTIMEFPCSAAIPAAYTSTLSTRNLSTIAYLFYTIIYIIFYMLDEIIVFLVAAISSKIWLSSPRFIVWATFIGAMVLLFLGGYYIFFF